MGQYSYLDKVIHRQFLKRGQVPSFLIDKILEKSNSNNIKKSSNIFITGLARSGTTALLQSLDQLNIFASLRYKYMPFILSPKLANYFASRSNRNNEVPKERIHGDGIKIIMNSSECLDEPFWNNLIYLNSEFNETMRPHEVGEEILNGYNFLLNSFMKIENKQRFLIKNNNNHLRIISLSSFFKNSIFLVLFRSPLAHSKSLLEIHKKLIKIQNQDKFVLEYMNLIGHWEFGNGKKPFIYKENQLDILNNLDSLSIDYWLKQWIFTYEWILEFASCNSNIKLVCYEDICREYKNIEKLYEILSLNLEKNKFKFNLGKSNLSNKYQIKNSKDLNYAEELYQEMRIKSF